MWSTARSPVLKEPIRVRRAEPPNPDSIVGAGIQVRPARDFAPQNGAR